MYLRITRGRFDPATYDDLLPLARQVLGDILEAAALLQVVSVAD